jgi:adenosine deaminase
MNNGEITNYPKLEFHGHLNGLIPDLLLEKYSLINTKDYLLNKEQITYKNFFETLRNVSDTLQKNPQFKLIALEEIVNDYLSQNCVYLELRDTPRQSENYSIKDYLTELLNKTLEIQAMYSDKILIKYFLNLHKNEKMIDYNFKILEEFKTFPEELKNLVVGIDIGGKICRDDFNYFYSNKYVFDYFRQLNYKINFHLYEQPQEIFFREIINFRPSRISQCVHLTNIEELDLLLKSEIPLEILPSFSLNMMKKEKLSQLENYVYLCQKGHPLLVGTDNRYIFNTSLTKEYEFFEYFIKDVTDSDYQNKFDKINDIRIAFNELSNKMDQEIVYKVENLIDNNKNNETIY